MSKNLDGIVAKIRDVRAQKRPEIEKDLQKIDALLTALRDTRGRASAVAARYPDLATALQGISFNDAENRLLEARAACEAALTRLRRDSINIGVAAKAGQGKSQMLQMLTGLGSDQIPTGSGGACTAVRSIVHNSTTKKAVVHFLTPQGLLEKKVLPSYKPAGSTPFALGLAGKPSSLDAFLSASLSTVEPADKLPTQGVNNWNDNVIPLQHDLNAFPELKFLLGKAPEEVPMDAVRAYLVKDNNEKKHNVVDYVELWTPFEVGLPEGLTVYDLPGLEDPTPGIREDMLESVKSDADVVFFLLKPPTNGERTLWKDEDNNATDMLQSVYPVEEVKPKDWIQLILNEDNREGHKNRGSINLLLGKNADGTPSEIGTSKIPRGFSPVVCDCGSKDAVREMVDANIDTLVNQAGRIDDLRIRQADEVFRVALDDARALYYKLSRQTGDMLASQPDLRNKLKEWRRKFMGNLRDPFGGVKTKTFKAKAEEVLAAVFKTAEQTIEDLYSTCGEKAEFPSEFPAFTKTRILEEFKQARGPGDVENLAVRNQREAIMTLLRGKLSKCCDDLIAGYFDCVVATAIDPNPPLCQIAPPTADGTESSRQRLERLLSELRKSENGPYAILDPAFLDLLDFNLSFDNSILPALVDIQDLEDLDPTIQGNELNEKLKPFTARLGEDPSSKEKKAEATFNWLKLKTESILSQVTSGSDRSPLTSIAKHVSNTMKANFKTFEFRIIWGDGCEDDWNRFIDENKQRLWPKEFEAAVANSQVAKDWQSALAGLAAAL